MRLSLRILARPAPTRAWIGVVFELQGIARLAWLAAFANLISGKARNMDHTRAIWIKDPLAILADGAERGIVVQDGRIVELVPKGGQPTISAAFFEAGDPGVYPRVIHTHPPF